MTIYLEVDKSFAKLQDELTYTVTIKNEGQKIDSLRIVNPFNEVVTFKWANVNERLYNDRKIITEGFLIKNLQRWEEVKVAFVGEILDFPRENPITQITDVYYNVGKEAYVLTSNAVMTYMIDANMTCKAGSLLLEGNKVAVNRGEDITYKLYIMNKGNRKAEQLLVGPLASSGTLLIPETIKGLEGKVTLVDEEKLYIEALDPGEVRTCFYTVKVEDFPEVKGVTQALHIRYRLTYPNRQCVVQTSTTNSVEIPIETVYFRDRQDALRKRVSQEVATEGDQLTYTLEGCNVGTVSACRMHIVDTIPEGTRWIKDSLLVNGQQCYNIQEAPSEQGQGIWIDLRDCPPGEVFSMSYQVEVLGAWPLNEVLQTTSTLAYWYGVAERMVEEEVYVQAEPTHVILACIDPLEKHLIEGLEDILTLGETVTAHLSFMNKGNAPAGDIEVVLELPEGMSLLEEGWLEDAGKLHKSYVVPLAPQGAYTEPLCLEVVALPNAHAFINVEVIYTYHMGEERVEKVSAQEVIPLVIEAAYIDVEIDGLNKCFYPQEVCVGEEVACTFTLTNRGNLVAYDITLQEEKIEGFYLLEEGTDTLRLEKLQPNETQTVTYRAQVTGLPPGGNLMPESQLTYHYTTSDHKCYTKEVRFKEKGIEVVDAYISPFIHEGCVQQVASHYYAKGDVVCYSLPIANLGNVPAERVTLALPPLQEGTWHNNNPMILSQLMPGERRVLNYSLEVVHIPPTGIMTVAPVLGYGFELKGYESNQRRQIERTYGLEPIEIEIQYASIEEGDGLTRSVDTPVTPLDEVVYYTVNLKNIGNVKALEVRIQEQASEDCIYESGTFTLNGVEIAHNPLQENILLGTLEPGETYSIRYGVKVRQVPITGHLETRSRVTYAYYVGTCMRNQKVVTMPISVQVEDPAIQLVTGVGKYNLSEQSIDLEAFFNFDVTIHARGNTEAYNLYYCIEAEGISFEPDYHLSPLQIPIFAPEETRVISAVGKVNQFVRDGKLRIRGKMCYEFGLGVHKRQRTLYTEEQNLYIYAAGPLTPEAFGLEMSQKVVHIGDPLTLAFWLLGEGNCPMEQTMLSLQGFEAVGFQVEKVYSGEEVWELKSIQEAFSLGTVYPGQKKWVKIEGFMTRIPSKVRGEYEGILTYQYLLGNRQTPKKVCHSTPKGTFIFKESGLGQVEGITLIGDKIALRQDESILYTLNIRNGGNTKTEKIKVQLAIDERLEVAPIPYHIKGGSYTGDLASGLLIEELLSDQEIEIQFRGTLKTLMPKEDLEVGGTVIYEYEDGEDVLKVCEKEIPKCLVSIESADFEKDYFGVVVDKKEVSQGQSIHCQIHCQNGGNKKAESVRLHVELPSGFRYVSPPFYSKDRIDKKGQIEIGTLEPMEKRIIDLDLVASQLTSAHQEKGSVQANCISTRLTYKDRGEEIQLQAHPIPVYCISPLLEISWEVDVEKAIVGELVQYTLYMTNKGNCKAEEVTISDFLPKEMVYVEGSLSVGGILLAAESIEGQEKAGEEDLLIEKECVGELKLGALEQGQSLVLTFTGQIKRMPLEGKIDHEVQVKYYYRLSEQIEEMAVASRCNKLQVEAPQLELFKKCDKQKVKVGEEFEVNVKLVNTGSMPLDQVIFYDAIPEGILFVEGSFKQDGKRQGIVDLGEGVGLGPLKRQGQCILAYKLRVQCYTGVECMHQAYSDYLFNKANLKISKKRSESVVDKLEIISPYQTRLTYETQIFLAYDAPDLYEILKVEVTADILEAQLLIDHPKEAEVKGILDYTIMYRGREENRQIKVKKVWSKCMQVSYEKSCERLLLQVMTEKVHYTIVHKRALKVEVGLIVSEM